MHENENDGDPLSYRMHAGSVKNYDVLIGQTMQLYFILMCVYRIAGIFHGGKYFMVVNIRFFTNKSIFVSLLLHQHCSIIQAATPIL